MWSVRAGLLLVVLAGCTDRSLAPIDRYIPPGPYFPNPPQYLVALSGRVIDLDVLSGTLAMQPNIDTSSLLAAASVKHQPVYALYADDSKTDTVMSDDEGRFTLQARASTTVQLVAAANGSVVNTFDQAPIVVTSNAVTDAVLFVSSSSPFSAGAGLANTLGESVDALVDEGLCLFVTLAGEAFPFSSTVPSKNVSVSPDAEIWAMTNPMPPPTFVEQDSSPIGVYFLRVPGLSTKRDLTITVDGATPSTCTLRPGFETIAFFTAK